MTPSKTAFFQVLVGNFTRHLKLPIAFVDSFKGTPPCNCVLRGPDGKSWNVELEEREDGLFFHAGWKQFVKKHFLEKGDFLVFYYKGKQRFDVIMYDESVCEMDLEVFKRRNAASLGDRTASDPVISRMPVIEETTFGTIIFKTKCSCFAKPAVTRDTRIWVTIPSRIVKAEGLTGGMTLKLLVANKRPRLVRIALIQERWIRMGKGMLPFFRKNNISSRDTVVFEFIKPTVLQTRIFRDKEVLLVGPKIVNFRSKAS